mmetsp:Transcript_29374/g.67614  ORF Transcript_29374/g.67614 Transcript_29374/m.67614 type:complete len:244 (+) Transcript_29374:1581-2312(+)
MPLRTKCSSTSSLSLLSSSFPLTSKPIASAVLPRVDCPSAGTSSVPLRADCFSASSCPSSGCRRSLGDAILEMPAMRSKSSDVEACLASLLLVGVPSEGMPAACPTPRSMVTSADEVAATAPAADLCRSWSSCEANSSSSSSQGSAAGDGPGGANWLLLTFLLAPCGMAGGLDGTARADANGVILTSSSNRPKASALGPPRAENAESSCCRSARMEFRCSMCLLAAAIWCSSSCSSALKRRSS